MEAKAIVRYVRISPQKTKLVADLIRGKKVNDAKVILQYTEK
ncbi:MAG TPA: 50S ribosomal protein L22, partial [Deltaproteobacteria bacterium]|nr:50S ribosomal protein L22 [Deltaproteobacteria bacterium]